MGEYAVESLHRLCAQARAHAVDAALFCEVLEAPYPDDLSSGRAAVWRRHAVVGISSASEPRLSLDGGRRLRMRRVPGSDYWYRVARLTQGRTHRYEIFVRDIRVTDSDVAGYRPLSYPLPDAERGRGSGPFQVRSRIYPNRDISYRLYATAGVTDAEAVPSMIWFDGSYFSGSADLLGHRLAIVSDNLVHRGLIPPMVHILIDPVEGERSLQYDTVSGRLGDHVFGEVVPDAEGRVRLRRDAYSVGAAGESSGAAAAFGLAWFHPDRVARVHSGIGSFTGIEGAADHEPRGAFMYSHLVRRERRSIRIWLSDGRRDLNLNDGSTLGLAGSWPLANLTLADSLARSGHDVRFRFGEAGHNGAQGALDLPESLAWLWSGYDPSRDQDDFHVDPALLVTNRFALEWPA